MMFRQKSSGLVSKKPLPHFKILLIVEINVPLMVRQEVEKIVILWYKFRGIRWLLKVLPLEHLKCGFDDLCNMRPGVVVKEYRFAGHFPVQHALPIPSNADHVFFWRRSGLILSFSVSRETIHSFLCFISTISHLL